MSTMISKPAQTDGGAAQGKVLRGFGATRPLVTSISGLKQVDVELRTAAIDAQLDFQKLVADLATRLSAIAPDSVDEAIADSLRQTGEALQVECAVLWRRNPCDLKAIPAQAWIQQSCAWSPEPVPFAALPSVIGTLESGETCCFATVDDLPERDREVLRR